MAGLLQGVLRAGGPLAAALAGGYALAVGDLFGLTLEGVDLGCGRLLDVGCGPGHVTARLAAREPGRPIVASDLSPAMLRRGRAVIPPGASRVAADAMALPFRDRVFGAALSIAALKFWPDAERGLREMARVVAPGGRLVVVEVDREVDDARLDAFLRRIRLGVLAHPPGRRFVRRHVFDRAPSAASLGALAARLAPGDWRVRRLDALPFVILEATLGGATPSVAPVSIAAE
jgi:SAM-dependent methyltransferase